ncbi:MAG: hypothetical protein ABIG95_03595, partial [Candidatus Woesearchaeota archaeon]
HYWLWSLGTQMDRAEVFLKSGEYDKIKQATDGLYTCASMINKQLPTHYQCDVTGEIGRYADIVKATLGE